MEPTIFFRYTLVAAIGPVFVVDIFPQLQTCTALVLSANCTEGSFSSNIVILKQLFCF